MSNYNQTTFGMSVSITTSFDLFSKGIVITEAPDGMPLCEAPEVQYGDVVVGTNGDTVNWMYPVVKEFTLNVIPDSPSDKSLAMIQTLVLPVSGHTPVNIPLTITITYPNRSTPVVLHMAFMIAGPMFPSPTAEGRLNNHTYRFKYEAVASK